VGGAGRGERYLDTGERIATDMAVGDNDGR